MTGNADDKLLWNQKKAAIETFLGSLMPSAKMMSLYKPGHPAILPITERVNNLLLKALGLETTLVIDIRGKTVSAEDAPLAETKDINLLAGTMHTFGVGQVLFTNRLTSEGMYEFLKALLMKAGEDKNLTAVQKELQKLKIPGLQLSFVVSVVDTGSVGADQKPGQLTEEQVLAFTSTGTLQDFLLLLYRQNEALTGKDAETVTAALDNVLNRESSLEQFQAAMLWDHYDPRIRACWYNFMQKMQWSPKDRKKKPLQNWDRNSVISQTGLFQKADLDALRARTTQEKPEAVRFALETVHAVLRRPVVPVQGRLALMAYGRLLSELGKDGDISALIAEYKQWRDPKPFSETVLKLLEEKVASPVLAGNLVRHLASLQEKTPEFSDLENFMAVLGLKNIPLFLEELRKLEEMNSRRKLCLLLTSVCRRLQSVQPLLPALSDPDWFLVRNVVVILGDVNRPGTAERIAPALYHEHPKVREAAIRSLGKLGDAAAADALSSFIVKWNEHEESFTAITALSFLAGQGVEEKLIQAYGRKDHYGTRVAIVTALARVATPASMKFLGAQAKKSFLEMLTGANKELRRAARESFNKVKGALKT
ncbi:MAG: HEAT repeat domain-containing protein [Elusimicrobia bacterium]|nr:HEAT repeat domain-containing protein [Elusimicrobiota bacterium]